MTTARAFLLALSIAGLSSSAAWAQAATPPSRPPDWFIYGLIALVYVCALLGILTVRNVLLASDKWSLSDALSEEADLTTEKADPSDATKKIRVTETRLVASTSRLIALLGMIAILALFLGFAGIVLWYFGESGTVPPDTTKVIQFLVAGLTLFAPYVVNKFSSLFDVKLAARSSARGD